MAGGGISAGGGGTQFEAKITPIVIISCIMAATGGLMFGYDVGVSGGVTSMDDFLKKFFPVVYRRTKEGNLDSNYCKYDNQGLQLFTSSLYLAGLTSTFFAFSSLSSLHVLFASYPIQPYEKTLTPILCLSLSTKLWQGEEFRPEEEEHSSRRRSPPYNKKNKLPSEMNLNCTMIKGGWGWRVSLGLAGIPAVLLTVGALLVVDTPNSLIERGHLDEGKAVLKRIRGIDNVEPEYLELVEASRVAKQVKHPFRNLLKRRNRSQLIIAVALQIYLQAVPLFLSEIAPTRIRGGLNILFQLNVTIGILFANLVNYGTSKIKGGWGWRVSLGLAGIPAVLLTVGALLVVDTPNSLIERGHLDEGKAVLKRIRGIDNVEPEYLELVEASRVAKQVKHPFRNLLKRRNRPQLIIAVFLQIFQQLTGINAIMFYAPVLFNTLGFKNDASLYSAVITGAVNVISTVVSIYSVDKVGRRFLLLEAGVQMFLSQSVIAIILGLKVKDHTTDLHSGYAIFVVIMVCTFVSGFAWSWGPLGWLIPSETFPLETRSAGQSVTVCVNLLFTFVIAQAFLSMLCHFKFGIFLFFSGWVLVMSFFVFFLLPETKNVPIEEMTEKVWKQHWLWKRFMDDDDEVAVEIGKVDGAAKKNGHSNGFNHASQL
ncbi:sugar transport protein 13-like [Camellia sinensis]|nr:sugar transport protein 13-like [Camellia sinensis]